MSDTVVYDVLFQFDGFADEVSQQMTSAGARGISQSPTRSECSAFIFTAL